MRRTDSQKNKFIEYESYQYDWEGRLYQWNFTVNKKRVEYNKAKWQKYCGEWIKLTVFEQFVVETIIQGLGGG